MTAGLNGDVVTLNRTCGQAVLALVQALDTVSGINDMLANANRGFAVITNPDSTTTDPLVTAGMSSGDAAILRESFLALALLRQVAFGETAQAGASPSNFFFQAQQLLGCQPI